MVFNHSVIIRLSAEEKQKLVKMAEERELSITDFIKIKVFGEWIRLSGRKRKKK